jgi:uncharacterized protein YcfJ
VGALVGALVGASVGAVVGASVGAVVGALVGASVGAIVPLETLNYQKTNKTKTKQKINTRGVNTIHSTTTSCERSDSSWFHNIVAVYYIVGGRSGANVY